MLASLRLVIGSTLQEPGRPAWESLRKENGRVVLGWKKNRIAPLFGVGILNDTTPSTTTVNFLI